MSKDIEEVEMLPEYDFSGGVRGTHVERYSAQRLYTRLGYVIDGNGVHYQDIPIQMGKAYPFDDEMVLYFTKQIALQDGQV